MSIEISLHFFILFYFALCLLALLADLKGKSLAFFLAMYFLFCALLVLPSVRFLKAKVVISFAASSSKVSCDFSPRNILLNFALVFPLSGILKNKYSRIFSFLSGATFGAAVELLQLVLPLGRVVDPADIVLCALGALLSHVFCRAFKRRRQSLLL